MIEPITTIECENRGANTVTTLYSGEVIVGAIDVPTKHAQSIISALTDHRDGISESTGASGAAGKQIIIKGKK